MGNRYAAGKHTIAECDRCGFRYKLKELKPLVIRGFEKDHPQNRLGLYPVEDPQAIRNPRPDLSRFAESDARNYQFGFNPVGLSDAFNLDNVNDLVGTGGVGTVTVTTS